ncbi:hypothetical protein KP509_11G023100 [Ceratopteris richardii]|uniref:Uncharacterized protein n=1 Tax=Ceratopteris richardii TaxID=49495 RepID=A0A8T2TN36_CERRI|nr:hypothetical protein KP509_11G023100 [Ceratopteris richardii]
MREADARRSEEGCRSFLAVVELHESKEPSPESGVHPQEQNVAGVRRKKLIRYHVGRRHWRTMHRRSCRRIHQDQEDTRRGTHKEDDPLYYACEGVVIYTCNQLSTDS